MCRATGSSLTTGRARKMSLPALTKASVVDMKGAKQLQRQHTRVVDWRLACTTPPRMPLKARIRYSGSAHFIRIAADMFLRCSSASTRLSGGALCWPLFDEGCLVEVPTASAAVHETVI